jgi:hypothetical protein
MHDTRQVGIQANNTIKQILVRDISGKAVYNSMVNDVNTSVDFTGLKTSFYLLTVFQENSKPATFKIIL